MQDAPPSSDQITTHIGDNAHNVNVGQNITQIIINAPTPSSIESPSDWTEAEQRYRTQVVTHYNKVALTSLPERETGLHELALEKIFIQLTIELSQPPNHHFIELGKSQYRQLESPSYRSEPITFSVAEALGHYSRLVVIGRPGSGKTTLTRWLAVIFAQQKQADIANLGVRFQQDHLPVLLELRRFADYFMALRQQPTVPDLVEVIATFISKNAYYPGVPADFVQRALAHGRCLLLLDGLDEIADLGVRQLVNEAINAFLSNPDASYGKNRVLVTSRPYGYKDMSLTGFQECQIKPFGSSDVQAFIRHWYATAYSDQEHAEATELINAIEAHERVSDLATNPLLCTIIAIVYRNNRVLPNRRVELYLKCCEALLDTWERNKAIKESGLIGKYDWQTKLELLAPLAFWLHSEAKRLAAPADEFTAQLARLLRQRQLGDPAKAEQEAREFIEAIRDRSGLLQGRGDGTLEFMHRTFQEYLAARYIAARHTMECINLVMEHLHEVWWYEVHLLVIGNLGSSSTTAKRASHLLITILDAIPEPWPGLRSFSLDGSIGQVHWLANRLQGQGNLLTGVAMFVTQILRKISVQAMTIRNI